MYKIFLRKLSDTTLKRKIVFLMGGLVTITPTILVAILAVAYYSLGVEKLFNDKISSSIAETVKIAELYLKEHRDNIKSDILQVVNDIDRNYLTLAENPEYFSAFLNKQAELRSFSEAMVFTPSQVLGRTYLSFSLNFERLPEDIFSRTEEGKPIILDDDPEDRVRAIIKLHNFRDTYLLVGRYVDKEIINHLKSTKGSAHLYKTLLEDKDKTQFKLGLAFIILSILLCASASFIAIRLAKIISRPINHLVEAITKIKEGDYSVRVPERDHAKDETAILAKAFNSMTKKIAEQTEELINAKDIIDERRRFIETVLREVSSGVIAINPKGIITLCNQSAIKLLQIQEKLFLNKNYRELISEISDLLDKAKNSPQNLVEDNVILERGEKKIYLFVRIGTVNNTKGKLERYIITFDDMSKLIAAQRSAAWADVARRIAHEIKNPLTPINLSAEQIKRKFSKEITSDSDLFSKYIDTIIRHVSDIGNMVEEFVQFARIPSPKFGRHDLYKIINDVIFSQTNFNPHVEYQFDKKTENCYVNCDRAQVTQVLLNLIKNSNEAIELKSHTNKVNGLIKISCNINKELDLVTISVQDNGQGIPKELLDQISEPYITTKNTGTGLGLSIVKKIIEDHGGIISIENVKDGALVKFTLKLSNDNNLNNEESNAESAA